MATAAPFDGVKTEPSEPGTEVHGRRVVSLTKLPFDTVMVIALAA